MSDPQSTFDRECDKYTIAKANRDAALAAYQLAEEELRLASRKVDQTYNELLKHKQGGAS